MASKLFRCMAGLAIAFTWGFTAPALPVHAASAADTVPTRFHHFKFYLDPALLTDMGFARAVLPKYVSDLNFVLAKNTDRQLVFDPDTDIVAAPTKPETDSAKPPLPTDGFEIWAYAIPTTFSISYGGFASVDISGAGVLARLNWTRLYDPDQLATLAQAQDYTTQIDVMLHELAHVFGAGLGEYYSLSHVQDTSQAAPLLNINVTDQNDPYWSDKPDFRTDPLLELNRAASRADYLATARYSNLTAVIVSGAYRNGFSSFDRFTVQVVDEEGQAVPGAEVKAWNIPARSTSPGQLLYDVTTDGNGQAVLAWGGTGSLHNAANLLRLIKVYVNGLPYTPARYVSVFDADIAQLVRGQSALLVQMQEINHPPTDIALSNSAIDENQPAGTLVGELGAVDADAGDRLTFRFCGGMDDASFQINGNGLLSAFPFDYERQKSYSICLEADDGRGGVLDRQFSIQVNDLPDTIVISLPAMGGNDGWVLESGRGTNQGSSLNATALNMLVGNDASNRRYRSVLAFKTGGLPAGAIITKVTLKLRKQAVSGVDPFSVLGKLVVDVGKPLVGTSALLQSTDFQAQAGLLAAGVIPRQVNSQGWYVAALSPSAYPLLQAGGPVQLRLRFNLAAAVGVSNVAVYSGNAALLNRPVLLVEYELP